MSKSKHLRILSLFDGISALQVALNNIGIKHYDYYASEIDKYAIQATQKNFPNTVQLGDVKQISFYENIGQTVLSTDKIETEADFDIICGGSPCEDISIAKRNRKGLQGDFSRLFYEYVRILKEVKPKLFIFENVNSMSTDVRDTITKELYNIDPIMLNSSLVTAQQRKRPFWVGLLERDGTYKKVEINQPQDRGILFKDVLESGQTYQEKSYTLTASYGGATFKNTLEKKQRSMVLEPIGCAIRGRYNLEGKIEQKMELRNDFKVNCLTSTTKDSLVYSPIRIGKLGKGSQGERIYSVQGKSVCLSANGGGRGEKTRLYKIDLPDEDYIARKLTPNECARLQGFPDNYLNGTSNARAYKCYGKSFTVPIIEHILLNIFNQEILVF